MAAVAVAEVAFEGPVPEVLRGEELHVLLLRDDENPFLLWLIPDDMRVAEVGNVGGQHGVGGVFGERLAVVGAVGHALRLRLSGRGVVSQDSAGAEARRVVLIDHSAAAEDGAEGVGLNGLTLKRPVHQVGAGGVAPRHVLPRRSEGVVLVIEIPHAVLVEQSVGIVHPAISRRVVIDGAETLAVGHIERIGCPHELPAGHVACGHFAGRGT